MLLSGFTFIRNALKYDFPFKEAVESMLPIIDELVINVGRSEDGTEDYVAKLVEQWKAAGFNKPIQILNSVWDDSKTDSGLVLSEQTNIALAACRGRWALYLQADEALHEGEHGQILRALANADQDSSLEGIRFRYLHFYGGYTLVQRPWNWYPSEIRIVRTGRSVLSFGDAQTFRKPNGSKIKTNLIDAHVFHYGHARHPDSMKRKITYFHRFWHGDNHGISVDNPYNLDARNLVWFWGTHPAPYAKRISDATWSPKPSLKTLTEVVLTAGSLEARSLGLAIVNALSSQNRDGRTGHKVVMVNGPAGLLAKSDVPAQQRVWIDLDAQSRSTVQAAALTPLTRFKFGRRLAYIPQGAMPRFKQALYTDFAWGTHENPDEGFHVPRERRAELILKTAGLWT